ncbi:YqcI/YcgG family protein [Agrobacterium rubi]|uniref:YqcI/YcgG family protein n=1 Tax=Agrobacterium rubi TaxID=28099 RepID=UPI0009DF03D2|nr:YqcI/YcgG family protein [Agrobacterium rubi]MBP1880277.1 FPC/CPF motif-containing protein YcgG [Agrobacterium rubi]
MLTFIDGWQETKDLDLLCSHMTQYCDYIKSSHGAGEICPPLMVIFHPQRKMDELYHYSNASWYILQYLHYRDKHAWPNEIPTDPDDPLWSFCFNGCQLFINITSPVLGKHRSRVLSNSLVFTIQPRTNFDIVAGRNTSFGLKVRQKIRERWMKYDGLDSADQLSMYGDEHNREWLQYFLYSDQHPSPSRCPLHIKSK